MCLPVSFQPPPVITDKQLDEREHTVEEWKGRNDPLSLLPSPLLSSLSKLSEALCFFAMRCIRSLCVRALRRTGHLIFALQLMCTFSSPLNSQMH